MKTLYLDCGMGAAGDMLCAALLELFDDPQAVLRELEDLQIPHVRFRAVPSEKCGIRGTHMEVLVHGHGEEAHHHRHSHLHDIEAIVASLAVPEAVRQNILSVYRLIAEAESHVHGVSVEQIHFHEVGTLDAIADITACCLLLHRLAPAQILASPIHTGSGQVRCAHGLLPVPAPATAWLLQGIPTYATDLRGELCTPTGAALLKQFATGFCPQPVMAVERIGYGMGKKDFPAANCVRALLGTTTDDTDTVVELSCNLDDMTGEELGFAMDRLFDAGALDVYTIPIGMKKSRPGIMLCALCRPAEEVALTDAFFRHTTTLGLRRQTLRRQTLPRHTETVDTPYGPIRRKISHGKSKWEYEDLAQIAKAQDRSLRELLRHLPK